VLVITRHAGVLAPNVLYRMEQQAPIEISSNPATIRALLHSPAFETVVALDSTILHPEVMEIIQDWYAGTNSSSVVLGGDLVESFDIILLNELLDFLVKGWACGGVTKASSILLQPSAEPVRLPTALTRTPCLLLAGVDHEVRAKVLYSTGTRQFGHYATVAFSEKVYWIGIPCRHPHFGEILLASCAMDWLEYDEDDVSLPHQGEGEGLLEGEVPEERGEPDVANNAMHR